MILGRHVFNAIFGISRNGWPFIQKYMSSMHHRLAKRDNIFEKSSPMLIKPRIFEENLGESRFFWQDCNMNIYIYIYINNRNGHFFNYL